MADRDTSRSAPAVSRSRLGLVERALPPDVDAEGLR